MSINGRDAHLSASEGNSEGDYLLLVSRLILSLKIQTLFWFPAVSPVRVRVMCFLECFMDLVRHDSREVMGVFSSIFLNFIPNCLSLSPPSLYS